MKLIVDSGSTKATWYVHLADGTSLTIQTTGINPVRDEMAAMQAVVEDVRSQIRLELQMGRVSSSASDVFMEQVCFYGAGCIQPYSYSVRNLLQQAYPEAEVLVESDLLGAARALCGHEEGIACILGTGANSCLYDGYGIARQTPALGWILGDEGSGAVLGRHLVSDVLKGQLPQPLCHAFLERFQLSQTSIIEHVYRQSQPNRFLASLVPFLAEHAKDVVVHDFLVREFRRFITRNVVAYDRRDLPVSLVGGVAWQFFSEVQEAVEAEGLCLGQIEKDPIEGMAKFHA